MRVLLVCCIVALLAVQAQGAWPWDRLFAPIPSTTPPPTTDPTPVIDTSDVLEADSSVDFWDDVYERAVNEYGPVDVPYYENSPWSVSSLLLGLGDNIASVLPQFFRDVWYYGPSDREVFVPQVQPGEMPYNSTIHWFRKGLRIHDNPALLTAIQGTKVFRPVFILDPNFLESGKVGINRWRFLLEALRDLDYSFRALGSRLFVVRGNPTTVFPELFKKWNVTRLTFDVDTEPYARQRDQEVIELAKKNGVEVVTKVSHTLYDTERTIKANKNKPPMTYQRMVGLLSEIGAPALPELAPQISNFTGVTTPVKPDHDSVYGVPSLEDLGLDASGLGPRLYPGGETEGLQRMELHLARKSWVCGFEKPKTSPNSLEPSTTVLSPYLKFGCLSPRKFYYAIKEVYAQKTNCTKPPVSLMGQLIWREFFYTVAAGTPNFHQMEENPICLQVPWDDNPEFLAAWKEGRTGYPYIDAIMTQLRNEGWIHHLARHSAACFLTRGDLWQSWVKGQEVFDELLLDADYSLNAANWMWLSSSAFFHQYYRVYSPIVFGKKTDQNGDYIRKYIPILERFPAQYIYEPWTAPRSVQEAAGCIIGRDYPRPIVDHSVVSKRNIGRMKDARACQPGKSAEKRPTDASNKNSNGKVRKITSMLKKK
ncbi:cryptochrome-2-like isoform X1 [Lytechinus variegatus]|uniref:cryptochrome-2-like isoform X1 n=2 Tax=Lytechinus variegatus TaxID=7654 RepID=UPI001BB27541|nr:cryptochrome-2-like isoform X1 [Lytechinus variegatus]